MSIWAQKRGVLLRSRPLPHLRRIRPHCSAILSEQRGSAWSDSRKSRPVLGEKNFTLCRMTRASSMRARTSRPIRRTSDPVSTAFQGRGRTKATTVPRGAIATSTWRVGFCSGKRRSLSGTRPPGELGLREFKPALKDLQQASTLLAPENLDAFYHLGLAYYFLGEFSEGGSFRSATARDLAKNNDTPDRLLRTGSMPLCSALGNRSRKRLRRY